MLNSSDFVGGVPCVVRLHEEDILLSTERPAPAAFMLPRTTLLIAILKDVLDIFAPYADSLSQNSTQTYFTFLGHPVPWLYPVGAIKDYATEVRRSQNPLCDSATSVTNALPVASLTPKSGPAVGTSSLPPAASGPAPPPSLLSTSLRWEPLELVLRVWRPTKNNIDKRLPFYIDYAALDKYIAVEVRQLHKAAYTALFGSFAVYRAVQEKHLQPAVDLALYRPFVTEDRGSAAGGGVMVGGAGGGVLGSSGEQQDGQQQFLRSSPFILDRYEKLLRIELNRPRAAFLMQVGFPTAVVEAAGSAAAGASSKATPAVEMMAFQMSRVSASPPLRWDTPVSGEGMVTVAEDAAAARTGNVLTDLWDSAIDNSAEAVTLGHLLWRVFRRPCLAATATSTSVAAASGALFHEPHMYPLSMLWRSLAEFYVDPPASALEEAGRLQGLESSPPSAAAWAPWEHVMVRKLVEAYEGEGGNRGRGERGLLAVGAVASQAARRFCFEVQGTQPSLRVPATFIETAMCSSDRTIFVTVQFV